MTPEEARNIATAKVQHLAVGGDSMSRPHIYEGYHTAYFSIGEFQVSLEDMETIVAAMRELTRNLSGQTGCKVCREPFGEPHSVICSVSPGIVVHEHCV